jgi:hypothetical protein
MDITRTFSKFVYHIEPKPEGGFIARPGDPSMPAIEAATREELQQKIRATISANLASEFPGLKLPLEKCGLNVSFHIEAKPDGGFIGHSSDPNQPPIEGATREEVQSHLADRFAGTLGKPAFAELVKALIKEVRSGDVQVSVNRKTAFTTSFGKPTLPQGGMAGQDTNTEGVVDFTGNTPIVPSEGWNWALFRILLALVVIAVFVYFFLHRH